MAESAALLVDAQQAKTTALLRLKKAKATRDLAKTLLQQKQSQTATTNRLGGATTTITDPEIIGLQNKLTIAEAEVTDAQRACNSVSCEEVTVADQVTTTQLDNGNVAYNDDSLPIWVYILIALFVIGLVVGVVWFVIRKRDGVSVLPPLPFQGLMNASPTTAFQAPFSTVASPLEPASVSLPVTQSTMLPLPQTSPPLPTLATIQPLVEPSAPVQTLSNPLPIKLDEGTTAIVPQQSITTQQQQLSLSNPPTVSSSIPTPTNIITSTQNLEKPATISTTPKSTDNPTYAPIAALPETLNKTIN